MFDIQSIHIALLLWGCIFSLLTALCMFMSKNFDRKKRKWMLHMQMLCATLLLSDALAWGYRGDSGMTAFYMVRISNFLVFFLSDLLLFLFHGYVCCCLFDQNEEKHPPKIRIHTVRLIAMAGMLIVILSQFTHWYYYIDAGNLYHRNSGYLLSLAIPFLGLLLDLTLLIQYRKNIGTDILVSMVSYLGLPIIAVVIQAFYYGISLINIAISISMILMFVVAMIEQNRNLALKQQEATDLRVSIMLSQITPHFIYNTLSAIQGMCETDPAMAEETISEFAGYLRGNLDALSEKEMIPFQQELEHVRCYLAIEKKRFGDRIQVETDIAQQQFRIPALTLQPLVENAVKHGLCRKRGGGTLWIRTRREQNQILVIVQDNGAGFDASQLAELQKCGHVGMRNVESRLQSMCGGSLRVESKIGTGTTVTIVLPLEQKTKSQEV